MEGETIRLGEVATYINGYAFKPEDRGTKGLPIIRIQDLTGNVYDLGFYDGDYPEKIEINNGDVLISWSASLGVYIWNKGKALLNQHIFKVEFNKTSINKQYFVYAVQHKLRDMESKSHGATMKHIVKKDFDNITIPYPSQDIQDEIAKKLTRISKVIEDRKKQLGMLDGLIKSRFMEMFGDPVDNEKKYNIRKLGSLASKISDGVHAKPVYTETGRPFLSVVNINKGVINFDGCKHVSEEAYQKMIESTHPERGDVLYTKVGATYGIPAYVDTDVEFCLYVSVCLIKPKQEEIDGRFLALSLAMPYVKRQADSRIKGIGVPDLHLNQISEFEILCPSQKEQEAYVNFVKQVDKVKFVLQKSLDELQLLFDSLMQKYFG